MVNNLTANYSGIDNKSRTTAVHRKKYFMKRKNLMLVKKSKYVLRRTIKQSNFNIKINLIVSYNVWFG